MSVGGPSKIKDNLIFEPKNERNDSLMMVMPVAEGGAGRWKLLSRGRGWANRFQRAYMCKRDGGHHGPTPAVVLSL